MLWILEGFKIVGYEPALRDQAGRDQSPGFDIGARRDGWLLERTEARLCAFLHLEEGSRA